MIIRPENSHPTEWQLIKSWFAKDSLHEVYLSKNEFVTITVIKWHDDAFNVTETYYIANKLHDNVVPCADCGAQPELRIDKETGKYYCTCPSSFYGYDDELSLSDDQLFDTMFLALTAWNENNNYQYLIPQIKEIVKNTETYDEFRTQFEDKVFSVFIHYPRHKLQKLFNLFGYQGTIDNNMRPLFFSSKTDEQHKLVNMCTEEIVESLIKLYYLKMKNEQE